LQNPRSNFKNPTAGIRGKRDLQQTTLINPRVLQQVWTPKNHAARRLCLLSYNFSFSFLYTNGVGPSYPIEPASFRFRKLLFSFIKALFLLRKAYCKRLELPSEQHPPPRRL